MTQLPGRTSWWPRDAAEHDRELLVELGEEFGPAAHAICGVLKDLTQQQNPRQDSDGAVLTGFRVLAGKCHLSDGEYAPAPDPARARALARAVVERAGEIGWLDDLVIDEDGRRFTARISGWDADSARGRAAIKKAGQRAAQGGPVPAEGDTQPPVSPSVGTTASPVPAEGDQSPSVPLRRKEQTIVLQEENARVPAGAGRGEHPYLQQVLDILKESRGLVVEPASVLSALRAKPESDALEAAHTVVSWSHEPGGTFTPNANRLLLRAFERQVDDAARRQARAQRPAPAGARSAPGAAIDDAAAARAEAERLEREGQTA